MRKLFIIFFFICVKLNAQVDSSSYYIVIDSDHRQMIDTARKGVNAMDIVTTADGRGVVPYSCKKVFPELFAWVKTKDIVYLSIEDFPKAAIIF